jgi:uncharacterized protein YbcC (UPF0753/DUF2309 family)
MKDLVLTPTITIQGETLLKVLRQACKKIAPVWPLENFVAVNPYLGLTDQKFDTAAQNLARIGGSTMTLPISFYLNKIREGKITHQDLTTALYAKSTLKMSVDAFIKHLELLDDQVQDPPTIATLIDVATQVSAKDWNRFYTSRISVWAASYFDHGQAMWAAADQQAGLFSAWKAEAAVDRTPEIAGLTGFRKAVSALPADALKAVQSALNILELSATDLPDYLHRLLLKVGGWSAHAARLDWDSELYGGQDGKLIEFLAVLICWEACLFQCLETPVLRVMWTQAQKGFSASLDQTEPDQPLAEKLILQEAFDLAAQREIIEKFQKVTNTLPKENTQVKAQAIFCIDVRSEVYRRNLELVDQGIETIGFAGFFAFPIKYIPIAHEVGEAQCPVLIKTGPTLKEEIGDTKSTQQAYQNRILNRRVYQVWKSFRAGAISCFSFVSPIGLSYLPKLFTDSFGLTRPVPHPDQAGLKAKDSKNKSISLEVATHNHETVGIPIEQRIQMAKTALSAMSLTDNFGAFVLIVGHGSTTVNNPYATGLDCGACGGHTGEANARTAAAVLNDAAVRKGLKDEKMVIPDNTVFLACLHDTTTDEIHIFNEQEVPANQSEALLDLKKTLAQAGHATRTERALRMAIDKDVDSAIKGRSKDWSQVRPEWGLAGCHAFVVAPRARTQNLDFGGQSFLHSYEWKKDNGFGILELIMTAPMVVTSWINLQYYASTVDNKHFGSGNKTLHNVTAGLGVLEGFSGDLRVGLPLQSVHDGENYQHEPVRLKVIIEAPIAAMNTILEKHESVRNLCDNEWIHLFKMDEQGQVSHRYAGNLTWEVLGKS